LGNLGALQPVDEAPGDQVLPNIAGAADGFFVPWRDRQASPTIRARALTANGTPTGSEFQLGPASATEFAPRVVTDGTDYLVAWDDPTGVRAQTFSAGAGAGSVLALGDQITLERAVYDGRTYLVFFKQQPATGSASYFVQRVSRTGQLLDVTGTALGVPNLRHAASDGLGRTLITYDRADGRAMRRFLTAEDAAPPITACQPGSQCSYTPSGVPAGRVGAWLGVAWLLVLAQRRHSRQASARRLPDSLTVS
jgi:hypothetical protein